MPNSENLSTNELKKSLLEAGLIHSQYQMSIYYKYTPDGTTIVVLLYFDGCIYWYTYEAIGK